MSSPALTVDTVHRVIATGTAVGFRSEVTLDGTAITTLPRQPESLFAVQHAKDAEAALVQAGYAVARRGYMLTVTAPEQATGVAEA